LEDVHATIATTTTVTTNATTTTTTTTTAPSGETEIAALQCWLLRSGLLTANNPVWY
jgi:hypothetical protein